MSYDKTTKMYAALRKRYRAPAHALLIEVPNGTGARKRRSADAVAMSLYPSRGLDIEGIEIKVSRSDWLRELKDPLKSEPVQKYCDKWWVAAPKGVVDPDELPSTWGLLVLQKGNKLVARRPAPKLDPAPLDRTFVASLGRRMHEQIDAAERSVRDELDLRDDYQRGLRDGLEQARRDTPREAARIESAHNRLLQQVHAFRDQTGIDMAGGHFAIGARVGDIVRRITGARRRGVMGQQDPLRAIGASIRSLAAQVDALREEHAAIVSYWEDEDD